jgi:hypothetical protein
MWLFLWQDIVNSPSTARSGTERSTVLLLLYIYVEFGFVFWTVSFFLISNLKERLLPVYDLISLSNGR